MPITVITILENFLAILANIVGRFGVRIPHVTSHVMFKISAFAAKQTFENGLSFLIMNGLKKLIINIVLFLVPTCKNLGWLKRLREFSETTKNL